MGGFGGPELGEGLQEHATITVHAGGKSFSALLSQVLKFCLQFAKGCPKGLTLHLHLAINIELQKAF